MKIAIVTINNPSLLSAKKLSQYLPQHQLHIFNKSESFEENNTQFITYKKVDDILPSAWKNYDALIFIMATGAVVRKISPFLQDKATDPAVLIMTLDLKKIIPLLSGHLGGANELALELTHNIKECVNFITTASDQTNVLSFDMFAKHHNYKISHLKSLAEVSNTIINKQQIQVITYPSIEQQIKQFQGYKEENFIFYTPQEISNIDRNIPTVYLTPQKLNTTALQIHPQNIIIGMGMNRNTTKEEIKDVFYRFLFEHNLNREQITSLASFSAKSDEVGLLDFAKEEDLSLSFFEAEEINALEEKFSQSQATKFFNIKGVAEPSALLASKHKTLFLNKRVYGSVTIAAAF